MMTRENAESLMEEAEVYIGRRYFVTTNFLLTEYVFVAAKINIEGVQFFPVALLSPVVIDNNIEVELIKVVEYFRR
ncbi:hypothetical protein ACFP1I_00905 [Dyadobacter subterraneus]|uniref:Uncharacterized protein n=1 Tax=Dyadobacter subterraneus TaxID=2773304 RepID=A0ABR9WMB4_9BACT|nr:hypothetical protein [Dyadobacter subterraneus]MBE9466663.1 hypothetical protein [Dyadobacter subterraneus]